MSFERSLLCIYIHLVRVIKEKPNDLDLRSIVVQIPHNSSMAEFLQKQFELFFANAINELSEKSISVITQDQLICDFSSNIRVFVISYFKGIPNFIILKYLDTVLKILNIALDAIETNTQKDWKSWKGVTSIFNALNEALEIIESIQQKSGNDPEATKIISQILLTPCFEKFETTRKKRDSMFAKMADSVLLKAELYQIFVLDKFIKDVAEYMNRTPEQINALFEERLKHCEEAVRMNKSQLCFLLYEHVFKKFPDKQEEKVIPDTRLCEAKKNKHIRIEEGNIARTIEIILDQTFWFFFTLFEGKDEDKKTDEIQKIGQIVDNPLFSVYIKRYCGDDFKDKWLSQIINYLNSHITNANCKNRDVIIRILLTFFNVLVLNIDTINNFNGIVPRLKFLLSIIDGILKNEAYTPETKRIARENLSLIIIKLFGNEGGFKELKKIAKKDEKSLNCSFQLTEIILQSSNDNNFKTRIIFFKLFLKFIEVLLIKQNLPFDIDVNFDPPFITIGEKKNGKGKKPAITPEQWEQLIKVFEGLKLHVDKNRKKTGITIAINPENPTADIDIPSEFWKNFENFNLRTKPNLEAAKGKKNKKKNPNVVEEKPIQSNMEEHHDVGPKKESTVAVALVEPESSKLVVQIPETSTPEKSLGIEPQIEQESPPVAQLLEKPTEQTPMLPVTQISEARTEQMLTLPIAQKTESPALSITQDPNLSTRKKERTNDVREQSEQARNNAGNLNAKNMLIPPVEKYLEPSELGLFNESIIVQIENLTAEIAVLKEREPAETGIYEAEIKKEIYLLRKEFKDSGGQFNEDFLKKCYEALISCRKFACTLCKKRDQDVPPKNLIVLANSISDLLTNLRDDLKSINRSGQKKVNPPKKQTARLSKKPKTQISTAIARKKTSAQSPAGDKTQKASEKASEKASATLKTTPTQESTQPPIVVVVYNNGGTTTAPPSAPTLPPLTTETVRSISPSTSASTSASTLTLTSASTATATATATSTTTSLSTSTLTSVSMATSPSTSTLTSASTAIATSTATSTSTSTLLTLTLPTSTTVQPRTYFGITRHLCTFFSNRPANPLQPPLLTETNTLSVLPSSRHPVLNLMMESCRCLVEVNPIDNVACSLLKELCDASRALYPLDFDKITYIVHGGQPRRVLQGLDTKKSDVDIFVVLDKPLTIEELKKIMERVWGQKGYRAELNEQKIPPINGEKQSGCSFKIKNIPLSNGTSNCQCTFPFVDMRVMIGETEISEDLFKIDPGTNYDKYYLYCDYSNGTPKFFILSPYNDIQISFMKERTIVFVDRNLGNQLGDQYKTVGIVLEKNPSAALRAIYLYSTGNKLYLEPEFWPTDAVTETANQPNAADSTDVHIYVSYFSRVVKRPECNIRKFFDTITAIKLLPKTFRNYFVPLYVGDLNFSNFFLNKLGKMRENGAADYNCLMAMLILLPLAEKFCHNCAEDYDILRQEFDKLEKNDPTLSAQHINFDEIYAYLIPLRSELKETRVLSQVLVF